MFFKTKLYCSDEDIKTDQTTSGYHHATNEQLNNTLEQEETFNLSSGQYLATKIGPTDNVCIVEIHFELQFYYSWHQQMQGGILPLACQFFHPWMVYT